MAFSFGAAIPVCGLHLPVCCSFLVALERLAGCRLQAVNEEEEERRGVTLVAHTVKGVFEDALVAIFLPPCFRKEVSDTVH